MAGQERIAAPRTGAAVMDQHPPLSTGDTANVKPTQAETGHSETESLTRVEKCQALNQSVPRSGGALGLPQWTPEKSNQYTELRCWQRVEADNGAVFQIDLGLIQKFPNTSATAPVYRDEGGQFNPMNLKRWYFDCKGRFEVQQDDGLTPWTYAPPRSVAAQISNIVCAGAVVGTKSYTPSSPSPAASLNAAGSQPFAADIAKPNPIPWAKMFQIQVERCWKKPVRGSDDPIPQAVFAMRLKRNGTLDGTPVPEEAPTTPFLQAYQDSALRAIVECQPFKLPAALFDEWKYFAPVFTDRKNR